MDDILARLKAGNELFVEGNNACDVSYERRRKASEEGQHPFAVLLTCADSRILPNEIFSAGIGDLFVVRTAGNIIGSTVLCSIQFGLSLGAQLILVMGHTKCGAVNAVLEGRSERHVAPIIQEIAPALGSEREPRKCAELNVHNSIRKINEAIGTGKIQVAGAVYDIESGKVEFLE